MVRTAGGHDQASPGPIGWPEMLLIDLLNRRPTGPDSENSDWFDDAWPEPYIEFFELGLVEGIDYEEYDDGSTSIGLEGDVCLTDVGRSAAEAARSILAIHPAGVVVSSVLEDSALVNELCASLEKAGVRTWRDIHQLLPGKDGKIAIRNAIERGTGFIACFSNASEDLHTYVREDLMLAVEQLRLRPEESRWFMPVLLDDVEPPDISIDSARTLRDLPSIWWYRDRPHARNELLRAIADL